jgi:hypothetical protein
MQRRNAPCPGSCATRLARDHPSRSYAVGRLLPHGNTRCIPSDDGARSQARGAPGVSCCVARRRDQPMRRRAGLGFDRGSCRSADAAEALRFRVEEEGRLRAGGWRPECGSVLPVRPDTWRSRDLDRNESANGDARGTRPWPRHGRSSPWLIRPHGWRRVLRRGGRVRLSMTGVTSAEQFEVVSTLAPSPMIMQRDRRRDGLSVCAAHRGSSA